MKKNLFIITMLLLCLMISISLVAVPVSAQALEIPCEETQQIEIEDYIIEISVKCEGLRNWVVYAQGYIFAPGVVYLSFKVTDLVITEELSYVISNELGKREVKYEMGNGDKLEFEFKFKQPK